jgi:ubiquinone/menaquinone biosynthesis C-methylase UbiE
MTNDYTNVTELPGSPATSEQLARLYHRYHTAAQYASGRRMLEVACGAGLGLGYLSYKAKKVIGGDYTEDLLRIAQSHYQGKVPLVRLNAQDLPFRNRTFEMVIILEAIYYIVEVRQFIIESKRVLDTGGTLLIGTVNKDWSEFAASPFSTRYFSVPELGNLLKQSGFIDLEFYGSFPTEANSVNQKLISLIRKLAIGLNLMPRTLEGRARLKQLFYGKLVRLPAEVTEDMTNLFTLEPIPGDLATQKYKIIYCIAKCP